MAVSLIAYLSYYQVALGVDVRMKYSGSHILPLNWRRAFCIECGVEFPPKDSVSIPPLSYSRLAAKLCNENTHSTEVDVYNLPPGSQSTDPWRRSRTFDFFGFNTHKLIVTTEATSPDTTMVAKDYPFYLTVKRANLTLEVKSTTNPTNGIEEPSSKRVKPLSRVTSLANLLPPVRATPLKRFSQSLQRSISFRSESRPDLFTPRPWSRNAPPAITKRRDSKLWSETFDVCGNQVLTSKEIKRQEAIFELSQGEEDLIEDLKLAKKAYHDPMLKLSIMTEQELNQIFGTLDSLIPLHEDLLRRLREVRKADGSTEHVGHILVGWLPCLNSYDSYCSNQVAAKALLDHKKQDHRVHDFLQRCLESPFSRKLDLWNFLDIPRSRLVKYHLLLKEILRHTPNDHPDQQHLEEAVSKKKKVVCFSYISLEYLFSPSFLYSRHLLTSIF
ncbi:rho guanine nucleotide exchange factor 3 isoform X2 [Pelobates cultripes]|uniref:Rho guanine nucleotide exchange factor 3 isoform X2 n=1 Tax=Pelobates cultripes TaxID=61616 RepID=A0AAD1T0I2_PELCU|nr:rho guanine nucleotide exchange factor 3 isoform X2 [Pelobates cultripes]